MPFIAITEAVFTASGDARVQTLERLTELMLDGRDLDAMLTEMGRVAGTALVLREPSGRSWPARWRSPRATPARWCCRSWPGGTGTPSWRPGPPRRYDRQAWPVTHPA